MRSYGGAEEKLVFNGYRASVWDEYVPEMDSGKGCMTL